MTMDLFPTIEKSKRTKQKRQQRIFEKLNEHAIRTYRDIPKEQLIVPVNEYQRDESEGRIAAEITMHFDIVAFGAITVIERSTGELVIADGGTRHAGAMQRYDILTVPCIVFSGLTAKQEADVFLRINLMRRKLSVQNRHHAELFSGEQLAEKTQQFIDALHAAGIGWDSLRTMRDCVKRDFSAANVIIGILIQVAQGRHITARVMKGMVRLEIVLNKENRTLDRQSTINKIRDRISQFDAVVNAMVEPRKIGDQNLFARAIARTLNIKVAGLKT
jgi:hypothetical protein